MKGAIQHSFICSPFFFFSFGMHRMKRHKMRVSKTSRRWIAVAVVVMVVVLVALCGIHHRLSASPTYHFPPYPIVYRSRPPVPLVQRTGEGGDVRVELITVGTSVNNMMCAQWTSSVLSGIPVTTAGYGKKKYTHHDKLDLLDRAVTLKKMRDWDVVVYLDQDAIFTGADLQPYIDDFIQRSPAHPDDINVREIRRGAMAAPLRLSADPVCWAPKSLQRLSVCREKYQDMENAMNAYAAGHDFAYLWEANVSEANARSNELFINSGFYMARVWALRELKVGQSRYLPTFPYRNIKQNCDQSIFVGLYLDQRWGEMNLGLLEPNATGAPPVTQFGMHYGLMDIWRVNPPATLVLPHGIPAERIDAALYGIPYHTSMPETPVPTSHVEQVIKGILHEVGNPERFVHDGPQWRYSDAARQPPPLRIAPSLLGMSPRLMDQPNLTAFEPRFPPVLHFADRPKDPRVALYLPFLGWYLAMYLEPGQRQRALSTLNSAAIAVVDHNRDMLSAVRLQHHCSEWIDTFLVNGANLFS